ncbi:hypothetical protein DL93DRAFT_765073 [Clavulina sp. PMI_390]|nr:hypothetical protein DL93DRAFT_765073 [Clavulina sp. PMI_390]
MSRVFGGGFYLPLLLIGSNDSTVSLLFQELPRDETSKDVPSYLSLLDIALPASIAPKLIWIAAGHLYCIAVSTDNDEYDYSVVNIISLQSDRIITITRLDHAAVDFVEIVNKRLFLILESGSILERDLDDSVGNSEHTHTNITIWTSRRKWGYVYCENVQRSPSRGEHGDPLPEFRRWKLSCIRTFTTFITTDLTCNPLGEDGTPKFNGPPKKFAINPSHFPPIRPTKSSYHSSTLWPLYSAFRKANEEFVHKCSRPGHSTLLSQLRLLDGR